jgi:hypothetical protein
MLDTYVGEIDVAVYNVGHNFTNVPSAHFVSNQTHGLQVEPAGFAQSKAITPRDFLSIKSTVENCAHVAINMFKNSGQSIRCHSETPQGESVKRVT